MATSKENKMFDLVPNCSFERYLQRGKMLRLSSILSADTIYWKHQPTASITVGTMCVHGTPLRFYVDSQLYVIFPFRQYVSCITPFLFSENSKRQLLP